MDYKNLIDPELRKNARRFPFNRGVIVGGNIYQGIEWHFIKTPAGIEEKELTVKSCSGYPFKITVFTPSGADSNSPALLYVHGGGFVYKAAGYQKRLAMIYARETGCKVFFPHYRLAPKHKYPAAYEDAVSAYRYITEHSTELGVDPERIGVAGDSAGASIAALLCNRWQAENLQMPCLQMLAYPVTDAHMDTDSMKEYTDTPLWDAKANARMWNFYCGEDQKLRESASPMHCPLPDVMPQTYIEVAQYDCLHDEGVRYGEKLTLAGVDVKIVETEGTFHGYDADVKTQIVRDNLNNRVQFLRKGFGQGGNYGN